MLNYITASFKAKEIGYVKSIVFVEINSCIEVECLSPEGSNFFINDFQVIDCDTVNLEEYNKKSDYYDSGGHINVMAPKFIVGKQLYDDINNKPIYWTGTTWVDSTGTPV